MLDALDESWLTISRISAAKGRAKNMPMTHAGATPRYTRQRDDASPCRTAWRVATKSPSINSAGEILMRTLNSGVAERMIVEGSLDALSTAPALWRNQPTLLRTQSVSVLKKPLTTVEVTACVTQLTGRIMHEAAPTI